MAQETIVFTQGGELPGDIVELGQQMKPAGFTLHTLPGSASAAEIAAAMRDAEYLMGFVRFLPDEAYTQATRLKLVQVLSAGYDRVNIAGARQARVPICSNGGANSVAVAEHTLMLILAVYKKLTTFHHNVAGGRWHQGIPRTVDVYELEGKTVGLVGLGNIGQQVARRLQAFDARVIYYDAFRRSPEEEARMGVQYVPLNTLLETADVVSLHVPLNDQTRNMVDAEALGRMKPKAILINTCRGEVVDEQALIDALHKGRILAAGLDTQAQEPADPTNPLLTLPNVTLTPHSAGPTVDSFTKRFRNGYANIARVASGQPPLWVIPEMRDLFPESSKEKTMADVTPSASYSVTLRLEIDNKPGMLGKVTSEIGLLGGDLGAIDIVSVGKGVLVRDITVNCRDIKHAQSLIDGIHQIGGVKLLHQSDRTFLMHLGGKIEVNSRMPIRNRDDLSMAYTPGVARVCMAIYDEPQDVFNLTIKKNMVAVVTDGTAVLGLGDIGPAAAMPVMEGKCALFKEFAGVDAFPICIDSKDPRVIVDTVRLIATAFGGINLEDISAPRCFQIEEWLQNEIDIPVFHDDQHGTSIVTLAALLNALEIVQKDISALKIVFNGVGASGVAVSKIYMEAGVRNIIGCDTAGAIYKGRTENMNFMKEWYAEHTNPEGEKGSLKDVIEGADVFVGLSGPNVLTVEMVRKMNKDAIIFAMANPVPEIMPEIAAPYVRIMATGRSDYPNQINNVLGFPGIFRGALDCRARIINDEMKRAAAHAIANIIPREELNEEYIIPSVFNKAVVSAVAQAVVEAAHRTGVARRESKIMDDVKKLQR